MKTAQKIIASPEIQRTIQKKHPWIFRNKANKSGIRLKNGDWLELYDPGSRSSALGIYSDSGLIAVRLFFFEGIPTIEQIQSRCRDAIRKRKLLFNETDSLRLIHGENDGFPGITLDLHKDTILLMSYSDSLNSLGVYLALLACQILESAEYRFAKLNVYQKVPRRIGKNQDQSDGGGIRKIRGELKNSVKIHFHKFPYTITFSGAKEGIFNDLRGLRRYFIKGQKELTNKRVLNLFSNNGLTSQIISFCGASEVVSCDSSNFSLEIHRRNLSNPDRQILVRADLLSDNTDFQSIFHGKFDLIIIDPPSLTPDEKSLPTAKLKYKSLMRRVACLTSETFTLVLCSCSNRIHSNEFERICKEEMQELGWNFPKPIKLPPEIDHPVSDLFPEGNYLKIHIYKNISKSLAVPKARHFVK